MYEVAYRSNFIFNFNYYNFISHLCSTDLDLTRGGYFPSNLFQSEEGRYRLDHFARWLVDALYNTWRSFSVFSQCLLLSLDGYSNDDLKSKVERENGMFRVKINGGVILFRGSKVTFMRHLESNWVINCLLFNKMNWKDCKDCSINIFRTSNMKIDLLKIHRSLIFYLFRCCSLSKIFYFVYLVTKRS